MYTCIYVYMYTNTNMYIYTCIYIFTYAHAYTSTYNLYIYMHMYFGYNYICMYIFIGINWGMTSYFKSSNLVPFLNLYNRIRQISFDRDRDQLELETVKNSTVVMVGKKRESVGSFGYLKFVFASQTEADFLVSYSPEYKLERAVQVSARTTKSFDTSVKFLSWWCNVVEVETHGNLVNQERHLARSKEAFGPSIWSIKSGIWPEHLVDHKRHLARVSSPSREEFGPSILWIKRGIWPEYLLDQERHLARVSS